MIEILFKACLLVLTPTGPVCEAKRISFAEDPRSLSVFQCAFTGQVELAKWASEHPNWRIAGGYRCRPAGVMAKA